MNITLPQSAIEKLPAPDDQGLVRVMVSMKVGKEGEADIVEVNGTPVPSEGSEEEGEGQGGTEQDHLDKMTGAEAVMPSPQEVGNSMY